MGSEPRLLQGLRVLDAASFIAGPVATTAMADFGADVVGFHLACPWGGGPTIARDAASGLALFRLAASRRRRPSRTVGLPESNTAAGAFLAGLGITAERFVTRMWLGTPPRWCPDMIFGVFNFGVA